MPQKTWAVGEEVLAADFNQYVQQQVIATFPTTAARDAWASPPDGATCVVTANNRIYQRILGVWRITGGVMPKFHVTRTTNVAVATATETGIPFDVETYDTDNAVTNGLFTCPSGLQGFWLFAYHVLWSASATGSRNAWITSTRYAWSTSIVNTATASPVITASVVLNVTAGQQFDVRAYHDAGGNLNVAGQSYFQGTYLSPS